jgi:hypothetical protein
MFSRFKLDFEIVVEIFKNGNVVNREQFQESQIDRRFYDAFPNCWLSVGILENFN